jgi:ankyrin repeat protein
LIEALVEEGREQSDMLAIQYIRDNKHLIDFRESSTRATALHVASEDGRVLIVKELLELGANVNILNASDKSALLKASMYGRLETCKLLVEAGADLNLKNDENETALDRAISRKRKDCGEYLLSKGAVVSREKYPDSWAKP